MIALPRIIGHRGAAGLAPENTLAAFRRAAAEGCAWVELDVRLTADGLAVIHDPTLDRTTGGEGKVRLATGADLRSLDAGGWFGAGFGGERVPTLDQALREIARLGLGVNVELKAERGAASALAEATVASVRRVWRRGPGTLLFSSFSQAALRALKQEAPELPRGLLVARLPPRWRPLARGLGCVAVHLGWKELTQEQVAAVKAAGFAVPVWTVNDVEVARRLFAWGVDSVITDYPDRLRAIL